MSASVIPNAAKALTRFQLLAGNANAFQDLGVIFPNVNDTSTVAVVAASSYLLRLCFFVN